MDISFNPSIPILGIFLEDTCPTVPKKKVHSEIFTEILFVNIGNY